MTAYPGFLNDLYKKNLLDFAAVEAWWVERVKDFFAAQPFRIRIDSSKSIRSIVGDPLNTYNQIVENCETDHSLKIALGS